jgi:transposase InsO family protein
VPGKIVFPDLLNRDFTAQAPNTKLVGDITYIRTWQGWVYLATVLDCFSKKVVGYAMAGHMEASLVCDALKMAARRQGSLQGAIFHSDRGVQYASKLFAGCADSLGVKQSMGRTGVCWDNAWAESFNGTLKTPALLSHSLPDQASCGQRCGELY